MNYRLLRSARNDEHRARSAHVFIVMNYGLLRSARNDEHRAHSAHVFIAVCDSARDSYELWIASLRSQ